MNRPSIFTLSAIAALVLGFVPGSIVAQQGTLKQQLVGAWRFVSNEATSANGTKRPGLLPIIRKAYSSSMPAGNTLRSQVNPTGPN